MKKIAISILSFIILIFMILQTSSYATTLTLSTSNSEITVRRYYICYSILWAKSCIC